MTNDNDSIATLRLLAKCGSMDLSMLGPIADEMKQLHAAVKTAQELAATRLMEIERLRNIVTGCPVCSELERNIQPSPEPSEQPQYRKWPGEPPHCMSCDCGMTDEQKRTVPEADYLRVHKELMDLKYPQQGASRDASSPCPSIHDHMWSGDGPEAYCLRCRASRT